MRTTAIMTTATLALALAACDRDREPVGVETTPAPEQQELWWRTPLYEVTHLPSLTGAGNQANGINNRGMVVGSSNVNGGANAEAVLWRHGSLVELGTLGGPNSSVAWPGINPTGTMVVGISETAEPGGENWACRFFFPSSPGNQCVGFIWRHGEMRALPVWPGGTNGFATGVNSLGLAVGWAENGVEDPTCNPPVRLQFRAALWNVWSGGMTELRPLPGDSTSAATAINDRGEIVGISGRCANAVGGFSAQHAVRWDRHGNPTEIPNLGGEAWHTPMDINLRGDVVGFGNPASVPGGGFGVNGFLWTGGTKADRLEPLEGDATSQALGINLWRQVVGLSQGPEGNRAVLWRNDELINLNDVTVPEYDGTLLYAGHINDLGVITGVARDGDTGEEVAFVAKPTRRR